MNNNIIIDDVTDGSLLEWEKWNFNVNSTFLSTYIYIENDADLLIDAHICLLMPHIKIVGDGQSVTLALFRYKYML